MRFRRDCIAALRIHHLSFSASLLSSTTTTEPAHFTSKFRAETFRKGEPGRVSCHAFGEKPIKIEWLKDNQPVLAFDPGRSVIDFSAATRNPRKALRMNSRRLPLSASHHELSRVFYLCPLQSGTRAFSPCPNISAVALSAHYTPQLTNSKLKLRSRAHTPNELTFSLPPLLPHAFITRSRHSCLLSHSSFRPPAFCPYRSFFKDTVLNEGTISELHIKTIQRKDSALYSCRASNAYGKDETTVQLIVQGTV